MCYAVVEESIHNEYQDMGGGGDQKMSRDSLRGSKKRITLRMICTKKKNEEKEKQYQF